MTLSPDGDGERAQPGPATGARPARHGRVPSARSSTPGCATSSGPSSSTAWRPSSSDLPDDGSLFVSKHKLSPGARLRGPVPGRGGRRRSRGPCRSARGTVAHKAIELASDWQGEPVPLDLVDEAMARLARATTAWATGCARAASVDRAELRGEANERVTKFLECFPPLKSPLAARAREPRPGRALRRPRRAVRARSTSRSARPTGTTAGKVLIDFKTGGFSARRTSTTSASTPCSRPAHRHAAAAARQLLPRSGPAPSRGRDGRAARRHPRPHHRRGGRHGRAAPPRS